MIYITGDTHGDMNRIVRFCERMETSQEDIMIILGDVGLNYYGDSRDRRNKELKVHRLRLPGRSLCSIRSNRKWCKRRGSSQMCIRDRYCIIVLAEMRIFFYES